VESYFSSSLEADSLNIDAMLGLAKCKYHTQNWDGALEVLNRAIASQPLVPCLLDKARVMLSKGDWSQASSMAERVLQEDPSNIAALRMLALHAATQLPLSALEEGGEIKPLAEQLSLLLKNMNKSESHNFSLYLATGHLFQTLMLEPRHTGSLKVILAMIDKAIFVLREFPMGTCDDKLSEVLCERGAVLAASGDPRGGMENYKEASAVDAANVNALHGMIHCQILLGANNDAMEQLDLVKMMSDGEAPDAKLLVLEAHLSVQPKQRLKLLDKASKALKKSIRNTSKELMRGPEKGDRAVGFCFGEVCLNASEIAMCVEMASLYLKCSESDGLERAGSVLREVIQTSPSLVAAHLLLAEVTLGTDPNHPEVALKVLRRCLQMDPSCAQAHLTIASIAIDRMNNLKLAQQSLDHALGVDFSIRNHPTYHLTRAKLLTAQGSPELALKQLEDAKESSVLTQKDEVDVSIATVQTLIALRRLSEAKDTVKKALGEFKGSSFEVDIIMCEADLLVARGDADAALRVLGNIPQTSNQFTMALRKKAKIQLEERRDKVAYTACFSELVSMATSNEAKHDALKQLGCALLDIQNPGKADICFDSPALYHKTI
jgi:tetratricopeptide repeat protein 21B